jgi:hypothetical protein
VNDERRLRPRYEIAVPIDVEGVRAVTRNLSMNGVIFVCPVTIEIGREIPFTVYIRAGNCSLECRGRVIRARPMSDGNVEIGASIDAFTMHFEEPVKRSVAVT